MKIETLKKAPKIYKGKSMDMVFYVLILIVIILLIIAYKKDPSLPALGLSSGVKSLISVFPILITSFLLSGLLRILIPDEVIANWLSGNSGLKGVLIGTFAGMITPGGPFVCFPIAATLLKTGAGIGPVVSYVLAWMVMGLFRIPFELAIIGTKFAMVRLGLAIFVPPMIGYVAGLFYRSSV